jgi:predicted DNA-binding transcriptional regulator AlpA
MNKKETISPGLRDFEHYPNCAHVRLPVVKALLGISSATVWRMVKSNKIKTYKLTARTTTFNVGEIRELILPAREVNHGD